MPAHSVFCSHCGSAQSVEGAASWHFQCARCNGITIGLGSHWENGTGELEMPLPPVVSYQESVVRCRACEASLTLEMIVRSASEPCSLCAILDIAPEIAVLPKSVLLSEAEMAFLGAAGG